MSAPPDEMQRDGRDRSTTRPSTCCASSRRRCSARSSAGSATSPPSEDAVQEALHRGGDAVAARRHARQPARLADPGRLAAHDRPRPQRVARRRREARSVRPRSTVASAQRVDSPSARSADRATRRAGRHARPAVHVLPPRAHAGVGDRADAARRRRPHDGRDRQRVPRARSDDGAADQPREAEHQDVRRAVQLPDAAERAERLGAVLHVLYLIFNEGYTSSAGPDAAAHRPLERGHSPDARGASAPARRRRSRRPARADAADRRAARGAHRARRRADPARRSRIDRSGTARRSPRASRSSPRRCSKGAVGAYQLQAAIAAVHDEAASAEDTDWPQILALYGVLQRMSDNPMVALTTPSPRRWCTGRRPGSSVLEALDADGRLAGHHRLDAVRAHLLELAGRPGRDRALSERRRPHHQHPGAELPDDAGGQAGRQEPRRVKRRLLNRSR